MTYVITHTLNFLTLELKVAQLEVKETILERGDLFPHGRLTLVTTEKESDVNVLCINEIKETKS